MNPGQVLLKLELNRFYFSDDKKLELLDDVAGFHVRLRHYRKKRRNLFAGSGMNGALTSLRDVQIRLVPAVFD